MSEERKKERKKERPAGSAERQGVVAGRRGVNIQTQLNKQCPKCKNGMLVFQTGLGCFCPNCGHRQTLTQQNMRVQGDK